MDFSQVTTFILLGAILGSAGQSIRVVVGLKKSNDKAVEGAKPKDWFDSKPLLIGMLIGAVAGILGAISL